VAAEAARHRVGAYQIDIVVPVPPSPPRYVDFNATAVKSVAGGLRRAALGTPNK